MLGVIEVHPMTSGADPARRRFSSSTSSRSLVIASMKVMSSYPAFFSVPHRYATQAGGQLPAISAPPEW
jgi:hypothetical protein